MSVETAKLPFVTTFSLQIDALDSWLEHCLIVAGIGGAPARRARARMTEMKDEVSEVCALIAHSQASADLSKLTVYADFDATHVFESELAKRADAGIQDLGSAIQDELAGIARGRKKELESKLVKDKPLDASSFRIWQQMSGCDCIEEVGATLYRLAEAARFLFHTEFLRVLSQAQPNPTVPPPAAPQ